MDDLVRWLGEQLDEDERIARGATDGPWTRWQGGRLHGFGDLIHPVLTPGQKPGAKAVIVTASWLDADHIAEWDPARVLREIDTKRRIIDEHTLNGWVCSTCDDGEVPPQAFPCPTLRLLALPYADRPGYREEWRP